MSPDYDALLASIAKNGLPKWGAVKRLPKDVAPKAIALALVASGQTGVDGRVSQGIKKACRAAFGVELSPRQTRTISRQLVEANMGMMVDRRLHIKLPPKLQPLLKRPASEGTTARRTAPNTPKMATTKQKTPEKPVKVTVTGFVGPHLASEFLSRLRKLLEDMAPKG